MADEPVDPDFVPDEPVERRHEGRVVAAVAAGGVLGAEVRYGLAELWPHGAAAFPWATLVTNVVGCLLIGVLLVAVLEIIRRPPALARPFLGTGVLGGFTTFSTFAVDTDRLLHLHRAGLALGYVAASLVGCLLAVVLGAALTRAAAR